MIEYISKHQCVMALLIQDIKLVVQDPAFFVFFFHHHVEALVSEVCEAVKIIIAHSVACFQVTKAMLILIPGPVEVDFSRGSPMNNL